MRERECYCPKPILLHIPRANILNNILMDSAIIKVLPFPVFLVEIDSLLILQASAEALDILQLNEKELLAMKMSKFIEQKNIIPQTLDYTEFHLPNKSSCFGELIIKKLEEADKTYLLIIFKPKSLEKNTEFKSLLEGTKDGVLIVNKNLRVIELNPAFLEITDLTREQVIGKSGFVLAKKFGSVKALGVLLNNLKKMVLGRNVDEYEIPYKDKTLSISSGLNFNSNLYYVTIRDISETRKSQTALKDSENLYRTLFNSSKDAIMTIDMETMRFSSGNMAILKMFGLNNLNDFLNKNPWEISPKMQKDGSYSKEKALKNIKIALQEGFTQFEWEHIRSNGVVFPVIVTLTNIITKDKNIIQAIVRDLSKEKQHKKKIYESEEKYKILVESSNDGIFIAQNEKVKYANPKMTKMSGYSTDEILNKSFFDFVAGEEIDRVKALYKNRHTDKKAPENYQSIATSKYGKKIDVNVSVITIKYNDEPAIQVILRDITQQKEAEKALAESEEKFKFLSKSTFEGILVHKNGIILDANESFYHMTGYNAKESIGKLLTDYIIHDEDKKLVISKIQQQQVKPYTITAKKKDGTLFIAEIEAKDVMHNGEKVRIAALRDISEKHELQKTIEVSEEIYRTVFENTGTATCIINHKGIITLANTKFSELSGLPLNEIIYKRKWSDFTHPDDLEKMQQQHNLRRNNKDKAQSRYEFRFVDHHKNTKHILVVVDMIPDSTNSVTSLLDITNLKNAEQLLKENEEKLILQNQELKIAKQDADINQSNLQLFIKKSPIPMAITDFNERVEYVNDKFIQEFGYTLDDLQSAKAWWDLAYPDPEYRLFVQQSWNKAIQKAIDTKSDIEMQKWDIYTKQRKKKSCEFYMVPIEDRFLIVMKDITQEIKNKKELIAAKEQAEESDRLKSSFLANMSHEIRTPMNGILGFTELLKEPDLTGDEQKMYIEIIKRSGDRMLDTVNDLIDISKIETGQMLTVNTEININDEMNVIYSFFKPEAESKGLKLEWLYQVPEDENIIQTDKHKLHSILTNLIKNAIKYSDEGEIEIGCYKEQQFLEFYVKDEGIGIPEDRLEAIFQRFEQVDILDARAFEGSGLGLAICKAYTEMLGGSIRVESTIGVGSVFYFNLPIYN